jgi:hypothetical protein
MAFVISVARPASATDSEPDTASAGARNSTPDPAERRPDATATPFHGVMAAQVLPLQHDVLRVRGEGDHRTGSALLTGASFYSLGREGASIGKAVLDGKLGGGDAGFDGILRTDFGNGLCMPGVPHCLFGRTLLNFELRGNERYFSRLFRIGAELGFFHAGRNLVLDVGLNAGLPLFGVTKVEGTRAESRLGVSPGASALIAYSYGKADWRLSGDAVRYEARAGGVNRLNVALCGGGTHFSLCTSFDLIALDEPAERDAVVTSLAFSFTGGGGVTQQVPATRSKQ